MPEGVEQPVHGSAGNEDIVVHHQEILSLGVFCSQVYRRSVTQVHGHPN